MPPFHILFDAVIFYKKIVYCCWVDFLKIVVGCLPSWLLVSPPSVKQWNSILKLTALQLQQTRTNSLNTGKITKRLHFKSYTRALQKLTTEPNRERPQWLGTHCEKHRCFMCTQRNCFLPHIWMHHSFIENDRVSPVSHQNIRIFFRYHYDTSHKLATC